MKFALRSRYLAFFAVVSFVILSGEAWAGKHWRNVPEGTQESGGMMLRWHLLQLPTRPNVVQKILIVRPDGVKPRGTFLFFPGGRGSGSFQKRKKGGYRLSGNFLVRSAHLFARAGFVGAIVDAPSDKLDGMSDEFRQGPDHAKDIGMVVDHLSKQGLSNIMLVGTSRGTLSAGYLATVIQDARVKGVILTSSMADISFLPLVRIRYPVLFVHHLHDGCRITEYGDALANYKSLSNKARNHFLSVSGGDSPRSRACGAMSAHGFLGIEEGLVRAISDWAAGKAIPSRLDF